MTTPPAAPSQDMPRAVSPVGRMFQLRWNNWPAALVLFVVGMAASIPTLPPATSFWLSAGLAALLAVTLVVNAWGRYTGGLLVTPALVLLFLMNVFPLVWSFGLSFFTYKANRAKAPTWVGLGKLSKSADRSGCLGPAAEHRHDGHPDSFDANGRRFPARAAVLQTVPASTLSDDPRADADDAVVRRGRRLLPLLLRSDIRPAVAGRAAISPAIPIR